MHHVIIDNKIELPFVYIDKNTEDYDHLVKSLRIRVGEKVRVDVCDGDLSFLSEVEDVNSESVSLKYLNDLPKNELPISINLYQGIPKKEKLEFIIEKSTELGVSNIIPVSMKNCIKKMDEDKKKLLRFQKIAKEASLQSMRHTIPRVLEPIDFLPMLENIFLKKYYNKIYGIDEKNIFINENGQNTNYKEKCLFVFNILCYEEINETIKVEEVVKNIANLLNVKNDNINIEVNIIVGPEGGFDIKEIEKAKEKNVFLVSLGKRILRTETAPIVILSQFINL